MNCLEEDINNQNPHARYFSLGSMRMNCAFCESPHGLTVLCSGGGQQPLHLPHPASDPGARQFMIQGKEEIFKGTVL